MKIITALFRSLYSCFSKSVKKYVIEGIPVYEAKSVVRFLIRNNSSVFNTYNNLGLLAFNKYQADYGMPDLVHAHSRFLVGSFFSEKLKSLFGIKYVITEHSSAYSKKGLNNFEITSVRKTIERCDRLITVSRDMVKAINYYYKGDTSKWMVVPNFLDRIYEENDIPPNNKKDESVFLNVAALNKIKNHDCLLKAFRQVVNKEKNCTLRVVGSGPELHNCLDLTHRLNLDGKVIFCGQLPKEAVKKELINCNCFVLSSFYETFGTVLLEALACGRPVISTMSGGPQDVVDATNGLLVQNDNVEKLAAAMLYMIHNLAEFNSGKIRNDCLMKYGSKKIANDLYTIYKEVLRL